MTMALLRPFLFPLDAALFAIRVEVAYLGFRRAPHLTGWASIFALLGAGSTALLLTRTAPSIGASVGPIGVAVISYGMGVLLDAIVLAALKRKQK